MIIVSAEIEEREGIDFESEGDEIGQMNEVVGVR